MCSLVNPLTRWLSLILYQTIKNETTAAVGGTALRSKTDSRRMKWASGHGRAEPKIQSLSPLLLFFFHPSLPLVLWFSDCHSVSPALSIMSGRCDFESVRQSLSGQAVPLLRESPLQKGNMCDSSAAIWLTTAVRHSEQQRVGSVLRNFQDSWSGDRAKNCGKNYYSITDSVRICHIRSEWRKSHTGAKRSLLPLQLVLSSHRLDRQSKVHLSALMYRRAG